MALVTDNSDPSGSGMFSKAGKFTAEKYSVFQTRDEILKDKPKSLQVSQFPTFEISWNESKP
jgi:hypothetical protein